MIDPNAYDVLTFDCYGTLIDWERGILNAMQPVLRAHGVEVTDDALLETYAELETELEHGPYLRYRDLLARVGEEIAARYGFSLSEHEVTVLPESVGDWPAFPDSAEALAALATRYKLVILSNIDDELIARSLPKLGVAFADVVTAQQAGAYKPSPRNFELLLDRAGVAKERVLHVAQSLFHDIAPAKAAGLSTVWVNRRHDKPGSGATPPASATPDLEVPDLRTLAQTLVG